MTPSQAPHAELIEKDFDGSFGIEDIQAASFEPFLPEAGFDFACPGHGKATRLYVSILLLKKYASNFKKSQIVDPVVDPIVDPIVGSIGGPIVGPIGGSVVEVLVLAAGVVIACMHMVNLVFK